MSSKPSQPPQPPTSQRAPRAALGLGAVVLAACGGPQASSPEKAHGHGHAHSHDQAHGHGHDHAHDPLVHRFEHANQWEATLDDPARDAWQQPKDVVDAMKIEPGMTVADIGAGTGYFEPWLSRAVGPTGTVLALDIEPDMVRHLEERAARQQLTNVRAALASTDDPKLPAAGSDRILIVNAWHHIAGREAYAAKLRDGLEVGGEVYIVDFTLEAERGPPPEHRLTAEQVARELSAAGLVARVAPVSLPDQYIVVGTRQR